MATIRTKPPAQSMPDTMPAVFAGTGTPTGADGSPGRVGSPPVAIRIPRPRFDELERAARRGDLRRVRIAAAAIRREYLPAHDGLIHGIARALSHVSRVHGSAEGEEFGFAVVQAFSGQGEPPQYRQASLKERVATLAAGWHWHATTFAIREDDDRVTFELEPCGSGMRLILEGAYLGDDALAVSSVPSRSNFMSTSFPSYCNECSQATHLALANRNTTFLVEGWTDRRRYGGCLQHTYKDIALVPDEFYRRVNLPIPEPSLAIPQHDRLFMPAELERLQTHPLDLLVEAVAQGRDDEAIQLVRECRRSWMDSIHDVCVRWFGEIWRQARARYDDNYVQQMTRVAGPEFLAYLARPYSADRWSRFWSIHGGLVGCERIARGRAFTIEPRALVDPDRVEIDLFVAALNQGLAARGWSEAGTLAHRHGLLVHEVPNS
jgi:hypothetical protein